MILTCKHCTWHVEGLPDDEVIEAVAGDIADAHVSMTGHADSVIMEYEGWEHSA